MMATSNETEVKVSGDTQIEPKEDFQDMLFYSKVYDNYRDLPHYMGNNFKEELMANAKKLSTPGKGILASDESNGTCGKRFESIDVENTEENRRKYRELLYSTENLEDYIVGAIMYDETIRQFDESGVHFPKALEKKGILTGIKVDTGMVLIEGTNDET